MDDSYPVTYDRKYYRRCPTCGSDMDRRVECHGPYAYILVFECPVCDMKRKEEKENNHGDHKR